MQGTHHYVTQNTQDDRVLLITRWVSAIIVPFLVVAFGMLYLFPDHTQEIFAWNIQPRMSAMLLGSAYIGGAYFFFRAAWNARWHWVTLGFLPVTTFATLMGIATLLHWDRFLHNHIAFIAWVALYLSTPFIVPALWWRNRQADPGIIGVHEVIVPLTIRRIIGVIGIITVMISFFLFLDPTLMITHWPWRLTPLTARVMGSLFALTGAGEIAIACYSRWSAVKLPLQSQMIALGFIGIAIVISWHDFPLHNPATWLFVLGIVALIISSPLFYWWMERRA